MRWTPALAADWVVAERAERVSLVEERVRDWATASLSFCGMVFTDGIARSVLSYVTYLRGLHNVATGSAQHYVAFIERD